VHKACHNKVHQTGFSVEPPGPVKGPSKGLSCMR
jgi:hypothetical protein